MRLRLQKACRRCESLQSVRGRPKNWERARPPSALGAATGSAYLAGTWVSGNRSPSELYSMSRIPELVATSSNIRKSQRRGRSMRARPGCAPSAALRTDPPGGEDGPYGTRGGGRPALPRPAHGGTQRASESCSSPLCPRQA